MKSSAPRLVDDLAGHLRGRLLSGKYAPREVVAESGIAAEYSVARPTARAAIDVLVADGLLVREAHLPARVAEVTREDLPEIVRLLEMSEHMALARLFAPSSSFSTSSSHAPAQTSSRRRPELPKAPSAHSLLNSIAVASGSERLALIHRRTTFEFLLGCEQHGIEHLTMIAGQDRLVWHALADAVAAGESAMAVTHLAQLHRARRTAIEVFLGASIGTVASV